MSDSTRFFTVSYHDVLEVSKHNEFIIPSKIYGPVNIRVEKTLKTFKDRVENTGVLFSGLKGNSKSLTAKCICNSSNMTVYRIVNFIPPAIFTKFLSEIKDECIIFIDEFEKIYNTVEMQDTLLSLLDTKVGGKKLYLLTSNSTELSKYLKNRPSRVFYHYRFDNMDEDTVSTYILENLTDKTFEIELRQVLTTLCFTSFDLLSSIVQEINRYNIPPLQTIKDMNIEVEHKLFNCTVFKEGKMSDKVVNFNPFVEEVFMFGFKTPDGHYDYINVAKSSLTMYQRKSTFVFENPDVKLIFKAINKNETNPFEN